MVVPQTSSIKYLGVKITSNFNWLEQIQYIAKKISKNLGILNKHKSLYPKTILMNLYFTLIYPYLIYCNIIWGGNIKSHVAILKKCQNDFIRILYNLPRYEHISYFFNKSELLSLSHIHILRIFILLHKLISIKQFPYFIQYLIESSSIVNKTTRHTSD